MSKPILYIDVDGVLFGLYGAPMTFQLRPGVVSFLKWADEHFDCRWLTAWGVDRLRVLLRHMYAADFTRWPEADWCRGDNKTAGIDFSAPEWFWIEDGINDAERAELQARGFLDRYIYVDPYGPGALEATRIRLQERLAKLARLQPSTPPDTQKESTTTPYRRG